MSTQNLNINISPDSDRLYWQASGNAVWQNQSTQNWVDYYTDSRTVSYIGVSWVTINTFFGSFKLPVLGIKYHTYGTGVHYGSESFTVAHNSNFDIDVAELSLKKNHLGGENDRSFYTNHALYKGSFDPSKPLHNLVSATNTWGGSLYKGKLEAGDYTIVSSFDAGLVAFHEVVAFMTLNTYAEQRYGNYQASIVNLNLAPVWTGNALDTPLTGSGEKSYTIPWSVVTDPDGDELTITANLQNGSVLPSWLTFNPNSLTFSGNPPAGTGSVNIRLTADDAQLTSTKDFTITYQQFSI